MALIIGVRKSDKVYIDGQEIKVLRTEGYKAVHLEIHHKDGSVTYKIATDEESVEIYPEVKVSCGMPKDPQEGGLPRLVIDAPRKVIILREELYLKQYGKAVSSNS